MTSNYHILSLKPLFDRFYRCYKVGLTSAMVLIGCYSSACSAPSTVEPDLSRPQSSSSRLSGGASEPTNNFVDKNGVLSVAVHIIGEARNRQLVDSAMREVAQIYQQCDIDFVPTVYEKNNEDGRSINVENRYRLTHQYAMQKPSVFIVNETAERDVAFSYLPSLRRDVSGTAWITARVSEPCFAWIIAHELGHVVLNDASHHPQKMNVMTAHCSAGSTLNAGTAQPGWTENQCALMRRTGEQ